MKCCICGKEIEGYGNNPDPVFHEDTEARCCDDCDMRLVLPLRLMLLNVSREEDEAVQDEMIEDIAKLIAMIEMTAKAVAEGRGEDEGADAESIADEMGQDSDVG